MGSGVRVSQLLEKIQYMRKVMFHNFDKPIYVLILVIYKRTDCIVMGSNIF